MRINCNVFKVLLKNMNVYVCNAFLLEDPYIIIFYEIFKMSCYTYYSFCISSSSNDDKHTLFVIAIKYKF